MQAKTTFIGLCAVALPATASAQFGNEWATFQDSSASMLASSTISDTNNETDLAWDDADNDGDIDVAVVRKQPFTSAGKRTNIFLVNQGGVLTNQTNAVAAASDVPGDNGFNTPTNDRDVLFADFNADGWLDMVTATTISDGDPKHLGHPRIYMNLGDSGGTWQGYQHQDARMPALLHFSSGQMQNPRFCSIGTGDVTGNGTPDVYFGDYDSSGAGGAQQGSNEDMNDRLIINDGSGFFTDESQARMTSDMLLSAFGMATEMEDMNLDGTIDVIKDTALNPPQDVRVIYNNPANEGTFLIQDKFHVGFAPYHIDVGDLNNDGRPDIAITDDNDDRHRANTGTNPLGQVTWGPATTFQFADGDDDGFGSNNLIVDIDGDGWNEVLIADVDVDISGYGRRLHIYHNVSTTVGANPTLVEEREEAVSGGGGIFGGGGTETGWIGVVGLEDDDLEGTHDVAVFDIDGDGDNDMVVSRADGTFIWEQQGGAAPCGNSTYGHASGANVANLTAPNASIGTNLTMNLDGFTGDGVAVLGMSAAQDSLPLLGGTVYIDLNAVVWSSLVAITGGQGSTVLPLPNNQAIVSQHFYAQGAMLDGTAPDGWALTLGLDISPCE